VAVVVVACGVLASSLVAEPLFTLLALGFVLLALPCHAVKEWMDWRRRSHHHVVDNDEKDEEDSRDNKRRRRKRDYNAVESNEKEEEKVAGDEGEDGLELFEPTTIRSIIT